MISDVLCEAVEGLDRYLSDVTFDNVYKGRLRIRIMVLRAEMEAVRILLDHPELVGNDDDTGFLSALKIGLQANGLTIVPMEPTIRMVEAGFRKGLRTVPRYTRDLISAWAPHAGAPHKSEPALVGALRQAIKAGAIDLDPQLNEDKLHS